jgi:hypothetical protein
MTFCENCGAVLNQGAQFCRSCGTPAGQSPVSPTPAGIVGPSVVALPPQTKRRNPVLKISLGVLALLFLLACLGVAGAIYLSYGAHSRAGEVTQTPSDPKMLANAGPTTIQTSVHLTPASDTAGQAPATPALENRRVTAKGGQCGIFTKEELSQVLGTNFTHADADATGCTYKGDAPREWVRTEILWKGGHKLVEDKRTAYNHLSHSMPKVSVPIQPYPGVGDEAWVSLWNVVTARTGDAGIVLDLRYYHDSSDTTQMLANQALSRLVGGTSASKTE